MNSRYSDFANPYALGANVRNLENLQTGDTKGDAKRIF